MNQQSPTHIRGNRGQALADLVRSVSPEHILCVAIDVSKDFHLVLLHNGFGDIVGPQFEVGIFRPGFEKLCQQIETAGKETAAEVVLVGLEPTSVYHENLAYHLHAAGYVVRMLNGAATKANREQFLMRWLKDDPIDTRAIGDLLRRGEGERYHRFVEEYLRLRQLSRGYWTQKKMITMTKNRIIYTLDRLFPGLVLTAQSKRLKRYEPLFQSSLWDNQTLQALIRICPNPNRLADLSNSQLIDLFHAHQQRMGPKTATRIIAYAQKVLAPPSDMTDVYEQDLRRYLADFDHHMAQVDEMTPEMSQVVRKTPYAILADVVGITPVMAAHLAGAVGDPERFASASQVFRYSGFVSGRNDSGTKQRQGKGSKITRAGNVYVRRSLDQITGCCILHQPQIRQYYHRLLKTKPPGVARVACIRRTTGILWATIRDQRSEQFVMRGETMTT